MWFPPQKAMRGWGPAIEPVTNRFHHSVFAGLWEMSWNAGFIQQRSIQPNVAADTNFYSHDTICYIKLCCTSHGLERKGDGILVRPAGTRPSLSVFVFFVFSSFSHTLSLSLYFWIFSQTQSVSAACADLNIIHIPDSARPVKVIDLAD